MATQLLELQTLLGHFTPARHCSAQCEW